ncbi:uncharacterized protein N7473_003322 [Penicillium subrubescens]|uniref:Uncharacterized protein n=1 Tax=Penicillium subrubescens TaxID=1316194 RepID=A0A1Q5TIJ4_9EURO|nr:uncharacterized protein N7473_003322 [Penicillium subrubescens]KAJ5906406.1 hypothetical protein N7473_003322 [Penicillium subrubescens]OKP00053.1 hypothetical protein PENSUB_8251 [Penicillium subrubescens]
MSSDPGSEDSVVCDVHFQQLSPYTVRGILLDTKWTRCRYPSLCYPSHMGSLAGQVRAPYLPIACELSPNGHRFLPDKTLDEVCPDWRQYMTGKTPLPPTYSHLQGAWDAWCKNERRRYFELGVPYPTVAGTAKWIPFGPKKQPMGPECYEALGEHQYDLLRVNAEVTVSVPGSLIDSGRAPSIGLVRQMGDERSTACGKEREKPNEWNLPQESIRVKHPATWLPRGTAIELWSDGLFDIPGTRWDIGSLGRVQESDWELLSHAEL